MKLIFFKDSEKGYSFIEMVVVILIIGILATVVLRSLDKATDISRTEDTKNEMDLLAYAIAGDPSLISAGKRTDFGYIGDVGALPPNWDALISNPGGYVSWHGPYFKDKFASTSADFEFKFDAWGEQYSSPAALSFSSTGSGSAITRNLANSISDLFSNSVEVVITDLDFSSPGAVYKDSIYFLITIPDGTGSYNVLTGFPDDGGYCRFNSIPIGNHLFRTVYIPNNDTLSRQIAVYPGQDVRLNIQHFENLW